MLDIYRPLKTESIMVTRDETDMAFLAASII